jgi:hypothetical protein
MTKHIPEKEAQELQLLYDLSARDIENAKRRQWSMVYYALLSFAAIVILYDIITDEYDYIPTLTWLKYFLLITAWLINLLSMWHIMDTHRCMCEYRMRLNEINDELEETTQDILNMEKHYPRLWRYFVSFTVPFFSLLTIGLFLVIWLLFGDEKLLPIVDRCLYVAVLNCLAAVIFFLIHLDRYIEKQEGLKQRRKPEKKPESPKDNHSQEGLMT